jgi:hypothetical protein
MLNPPHQQIDAYVDLQRLIGKVHEELVAITLQWSEALDGHAVLKRGSNRIRLPLPTMYRLAAQLGEASEVMQKSKVRMDERVLVSDLLRGLRKDIDLSLREKSMVMKIDNELGSNAAIYGNARWLGDVLHWSALSLLDCIRSDSELHMRLHSLGEWMVVEFAAEDREMRDSCPDGVAWAVAKLIVLRHGGQASCENADGVCVIRIELPFHSRCSDDAALVIAQARMLEAAMPQLMGWSANRLHS